MSEKQLSVILLNLFFYVYFNLDNDNLIFKPFSYHYNYSSLISKVTLIFFIGCKKDYLLTNAGL